MLNWNQIQANAYAFAKKWHTASNEEADAQGFVTALLAVFGVDDPRAVGAFERRVALDDGHNGYFDYLWPGRIAIEMKSAGKDLAAAYRQLADYTLHLAPEDMPELLMVSDFRRIELRHRTSGQCTRFNTANLPRYVRHFARLAGYEPSRELAEQISVNVHAAGKAARLHDALHQLSVKGHKFLRRRTHGVPANMAFQIGNPRERPGALRIPPRQRIAEAERLNPYHRIISAFAKPDKIPFQVLKILLQYFRRKTGFSILPVGFRGILSKMIFLGLL